MNDEYVSLSSPMDRVRSRIFQLGIPQERVALAAGYGPSLFSRYLSRYLRGRRRPPPDFVEKVNAAIDRLEAAEKAAQEAREKVLNEGVA